jgi:hypothetical protein
MGFMILMGVPINDIMAIYDDAPPCPTDEYSMAPKKMKTAVT